MSSQGLQVAGPQVAAAVGKAHLHGRLVAKVDVQPEGVAAPQARHALALAQQGGGHPAAAVLLQHCHVADVGAPRLGSGEGRRQCCLGLQPVGQGSGPGMAQGLGRAAQSTVHS